MLWEKLNLLTIKEIDFTMIYQISKNLLLITVNNQKINGNELAR